MRGRFAVGATIVALAGTSAFAALPEFLIFDGTTLMRTGAAGPISTFALSDEIVGGAVAPNGEIWLTSSTATGGGTFELYRLDDPLGPAPSLSLITDQLPASYPAITFIGDLIYATFEGSQNIVTIDPNNSFAVNALGASGVPNIGGLAYDASTDTLYAGSGFTGVEGLSTIDYTGSPPTGTYVGPFGFDAFHHGMDFFDGVLYGSIVNNDAATFDLGTINTSTGAFTPFLPLGPAVAGPVALVVVPAPSAAALLAIGGLGLARRRR